MNNSLRPPRWGVQKYHNRTRGVSKVMNKYELWTAYNACIVCATQGHDPMMAMFTKYQI